ncbi:MAG TPA: FAD-dependent oxidoreductase [Acidimicrobiales bacterium]|nr:FAD-dependent oxidoreductase [Acidimicrobiales bacterium]
MAERLVVIGGDAGGMAAISQVHKTRPDMEIVAFERGHYTSYSACGIPYLVGGEVETIEELVARTPQVFRDRFRVDVRMRHEVTAIDLDAREVEVHDIEHERTFRLGFDRALVATGGMPIRPDLPGISHEHVHGVQTLDDARDLLEHATSESMEHVVVVGGGYIGLEMAEAFTHRGSRVTLLEAGSQVMQTLDPDMAALVGEALESHGVDVRLEERALAFEARRVVTEHDTIEADVVVLGVGVRPNSGLAKESGLAVGVKDAVRVSRRQETSADGVWAAGDCCESTHLVSGRQVHVPLGTVANKQSRVAGINIGGGYATFKGVVGTAITRVCDTEIARTGLSEREATEAGFAFRSTVIEGSTRAGYLPGKKRTTVKLVVEQRTGRLLGGQIVGQEGAAKRIDVLATALTARMTVEEMIDLDLGYAPPFSPVWDPVLVAARVASRT